MLTRLPLQLILLLVSFTTHQSSPFLVSAEVNTAGYHVCTSDICATGRSSIKLGARLTSPAILLFPGTYSSVSPLSEYLPSATLIPSLANDTVTFSSTNLATLSGSYAAFDEADDLMLVMSPGWPVAYGNGLYLGDATEMSLSISATGSVLAAGSANTTSTLTTFLNSTSSLIALPATVSSIFLPPGTYLRSSATGSTNVYRSSIANVAQLPNAGVGHFPSLGDITYGSNECTSTCSSGGVCIPSTALLNTSSSYAFADLQQAESTYTCACLKGFAGESCSECEAGYYGADCKACDAECGTCDDGVTGTGGCLGVKGNSTETCGCLHGTCNSPSSCVCSAGWTSSTSSSLLCSACLSGFYQDTSSGDCLACPLGALTCSSATTALTCAATFSLDSTGACSRKGVNATCTAGKYYTGTGCASCSAACTTCTGPGTDDCLECASPRFSLFGNCVGYDSTTGVCDLASSTSSAQGVYVANNDKGECDSCPTGCLTCSISSFSISSTWDEVQCGSCQEGWMLQNGKCVEECGNGYFLPKGSASINGTCQTCDTSVCSTCITSATTCLTCATTGQLALPDGSCASTCPSGTYLSGTSCFPCSGDCLTCSEAGPDSCLTCPSTLPVRTTSGGCSAVCPASQYWDLSSSDCLACSTNCTSCVGTGSNQCLSCTDGLVLKGGACIAAACLDDNGVIPSLGLCFSSILGDGQSEVELLWWPFVLSFGLLLLVLGIVFRILLLKQRARRRQETGAFADRLDDKGVMKRMRVLVGQGRVGRARTLEEVLEMERADEESGLRSGGRGVHGRKVRFANPFSAKTRLDFSLSGDTVESGSGPGSPTSPPALFKPYLSPPSSATIRQSDPANRPGLKPFFLRGGTSRESFTSFAAAEVPPAYSPSSDEHGRTLEKGSLTGGDDEMDMVDMLGEKGGDRPYGHTDAQPGPSTSTSFLPTLDFGSGPLANQQAYVSPRFEVVPPSPTDDITNVNDVIGRRSPAANDPTQVSFWLDTDDVRGTDQTQARGRQLL